MVHNVNIPTEPLVNSVSLTLAVEVDSSSTGLEVDPWWCSELSTHSYDWMRWGNWTPWPSTWSMKVNQYKSISLLTSADLPHLPEQGLACRDCSECLPPCQAGFPRALLESMTKLWDMKTFVPLHSMQSSHMPTPKRKHSLAWLGDSWVSNDVICFHKNYQRLLS